MNRALEHHCEPDLLVDLHWTLAQCRMLAGSSAKSLDTLEHALSSPGLSARHRARLLVLAGRTHKYLGQLDKADRVATRALDEATEADDSGAMAWALHVLAVRGLGARRADRRAAALRPGADRDQGRPGPDRPAAAADDQPGGRAGLPLDQYERAFAAAGEARHLADQLGTTFRLAQAHGALGQLFFETGSGTTR